MSLFDTLRFTRNIEEAYRTMWEIYATAKPPQSINVTDVGASS